MKRCSRRRPRPLLTSSPPRGSAGCTPIGGAREISPDLPLVADLVLRTGEVDVYRIPKRSPAQ